MAVELPEPVVRGRASLAHLDVRALEADLRARVDGEVRFDPGSRGAYSTDASNYRQVPIGVVVPRTLEAGVEAVAVCREHAAPVLPRSGGTSLAGQCTNVAVVIDWSKHCNRILEHDPDRRTVVVEPGIVLDELNRVTRRHGLVYGPEPATHYNCTLHAEVLDSGCCGLAGNFGFEDGHYDVSMACAERVLLPRLRDAPQEAVVLADGFSCRTQVERGRTGREGMHLAEALAAGLRGGRQPQGPPEQE